MHHALLALAVLALGQPLSAFAAQCADNAGIGTSFSDVPASDPHAPAITWAASFDIVEGYGDGSFKPDQPVNRAEFLKIILGAEQAATVRGMLFPDVPKQAWFAPYVQAGLDGEIIEGYPDGTFKPARTVNLAEGLKMAYKAHGVEPASTGGAWYAPYLTHARQNEVLFDPNSDPGSLLTREDVVWIVWRLSLLTLDVDSLRTQAAAGDRDAQFLLATAYDSGDGVERDGAEAAVWYRKAAEQGDVDAQFLLGLKYEAGEGVPQDYEEAAAWYRRAEAQGDCEAAEQLQSLIDDGLVQSP